MLSDALLPEFEREAATTRRLLERIPDDALDWKPHEKSFTLQELATHITNIPTWATTAIDADGVDMAGGFEKPPTGDRARLLALYDVNVAAAHEKLAGASDETLQGTWTLSNGDDVLLQMPRIAVVRSFLLNHLVHHRGQLSVYLRLRDVPVPSIYGPSADEASF